MMKIHEKPNKMSYYNGSRESMDSQLSGSSNENLSSKDDKERGDKILHQRVHFQVYYLGVVDQINMTNSKKRDTEPQLVDIIEENQIEGRLNVLASEENKVVMFVSRHGIKVMDSSGQEVLQRHPLHTIAQLIQYNDGFNRPNIAVKIGQVGKHLYQCYIFQCHSEDQAQAICNCVRRIFDAITSKG
ncbi:integrin beta-1-binding protein 1-like [Physella acuta]|uniref:integrin beta-1-binding protein 1-like n=1 Tax=Physella acuta TaxID=109671 RepID=UPI0027DB2C99|nr:integrin beta-1-binding protein 1-like [Physella acuta]XP_059162849.1 integrin beta-1-binding protein 1-like [Physella acuta]XP_059162850.1 integrin beta-1-binding protein 1-like [Physella acuta]XP_059162851.1 integrin beta-1-binding protein 1-like [Physella acuta]XP_059162852.1 integrin beta-1-binding protein 1-like [Physella acuta]XP_059162853.1 integrin beta-1-binding protein 1-like [Physella acuta]XP_059162854.1 integrin beta-1-binding protein 1-like [Physella acuta]XP_059162855.1 int